MNFLRTGQFEFIEAFEGKQEMSLVKVELLTVVAMKIGLVGHEAMQSIRSVLTCPRILLPPSSDYTASCSRR
jgi:hypothetical protein